MNQLTTKLIKKSLRNSSKTISFGSFDGIGCCQNNLINKESHPSVRILGKANREERNQYLLEIQKRSEIVTQVNEKYHGDHEDDANLKETSRPPSLQIFVPKAMEKTHFEETNFDFYSMTKSGGYWMNLEMRVKAWDLYKQLANSPEGLRRVPISCIKTMFWICAKSPQNQDQIAALLRDLSPHAKKLTPKFFNALTSRMITWDCQELENYLYFIQHSLSYEMQKLLYESLLSKLNPIELEFHAKLQVLIETALNPKLIYELIIKKLVLSKQHHMILVYFLKSQKHRGRIIDLDLKTLRHYFVALSNLSLTCVEEHVDEWRRYTDNTDSEHSDNAAQKLHSTTSLSFELPDHHGLHSNQIFDSEKLEGTGENTFIFTLKNQHKEGKAAKILYHCQNLINTCQKLDVEDPSFSEIIGAFFKILSKINCEDYQWRLIMHIQKLYPSYNIPSSLLSRLLYTQVRKGSMDASHEIMKTMFASGDGALATHYWIMALLSKHQIGKLKDILIHNRISSFNVDIPENTIIMIVSLLSSLNHYPSNNPCHSNSPSRSHEENIIEPSTSIQKYSSDAEYILDLCIDKLKQIGYEFKPRDLLMISEFYEKVKKDMNKAIECHDFLIDSVSSSELETIQKVLMVRS